MFREIYLDEPGIAILKITEALVTFKNVAKMYCT